VDLRNPSLANAREVVAQSRRVIQALSLAADGIYLQDLDGGISKLRRVAVRSDGTAGSTTEVPLPFAGTISEIATDPLRPGVTFDMESWTKSPLWYRASGNHSSARRGPSKEVAGRLFRNRRSRSLREKCRRDRRLPLSIVMRADITRNGENPTLLDGYGAYGIAITHRLVRRVWHGSSGAEFLQSATLAAEESSVRIGILPLTSPPSSAPSTTLLACAHYLIDNRYTTSAKLAGMGTSAGGVTIGNAIVQHPELSVPRSTWLAYKSYPRRFAEGGSR